MKGIKYDKGKPRLYDFLYDFRKVFFELVKVYEFGTEKYGRCNWLEVENGKGRFSNALVRHLLQDGADPETEIDHQAHVAYNALMRLQFLLDEREAGGTDE